MRVLAVTNVYPTPDRPAAGAFVAQQVEGLRQAGVDVRVLNLARRERGMRAYWRAGRRAIDDAREHRAEAVHVLYGGVMAATVARAGVPAPVIVSFCGSDLLGEPLESADRRVLGWIGIRASHQAALDADAIVVKSVNLRNALPQDVDRRKVRVIPNGVDLQRFRPLDRPTCRSRVGWAPGRLHVLFPATNGAAVKRPELARAALAQLRSDGVDADLHELAGVPHADVPVWLNASDLLLLTSAHEGSPNVVKEALACDVPIVSVDVGDVGERIDGVAGCYLADASASDLARKMAAVASGPRRIDGRPAVAPLSVERVSAELAACYADAIDQWCLNRTSHLRAC
jgi:glycosyltransferase involved in cell wall biosynthesis